MSCLLWKISCTRSTAASTAFASSGKLTRLPPLTGSMTITCLSYLRHTHIAGAALFEVRIVACALRVHQIEVEVVHAAGFHLLFKQRTDIHLGLEEICRQLVRQYVAARIAAGEAGLQRFSRSPEAHCLRVFERAVRVSQPAVLSALLVIQLFGI